MNFYCECCFVVVVAQVVVVVVAVRKEKRNSTDAQLAQLKLMTIVGFQFAFPPAFSANFTEFNVILWPERTLGMRLNFGTKQATHTSEMSLLFQSKHTHTDREKA